LSGLDSKFVSLIVAAIPCPVEMLELFRDRESSRPFAGDNTLTEAVGVADVEDGRNISPLFAISATDATPPRVTATRTAAHATLPIARPRPRG
jgi:hypothetical protein